MTQITLNSTVVRSADQISTDLGGESIILSFQSEEYFSLEDVGVHIWKLMDTPKTAAELLAAILAAYEVDAVTAQRDLLAVLGEMVGEGLVVIQ